jgi:hypothetical protein
LYAAMAGAAFAFQACLSSPLSSFHFTEMSAFRDELLMPGRSSSSCFLASLLKNYRNYGDSAHKIVSCYSNRYHNWDLC